MVEQEDFQAPSELSDDLNSNTSGPWFIMDPDVDKTKMNQKMQIENVDQNNGTFEDQANTDHVKYFDETDSDVYLEHTDPMPINCSSVIEPYFEASSPLLYWGTSPLDFENLKMDDVFQVDKDVLVQSPTLAKLNANDESLFDSEEIFNPYENENDFLLDNSLAMNKELLMQDETLDINSSSLSNENEIKKDEGKDQYFAKFNSQLKQNQPSVSKADQIISTAPCKVMHEDLMHDVNLEPPEIPKVKKSKTKSKSPKKVYANKSNKYQNKRPSCSTIKKYKVKYKDMEQEDTSEFDDSDDELKISSLKQGSSKSFLEKKKTKYFWQYNMQSKGPKGYKMILSTKTSSANSGIVDPVFSSNCPVQGVKYSGKTRKGDGNDLTPNPKKLYNIGIELEKLNHQIDHLTPVNKVPLDARTKSRKEKNKLASRACRLKKKAQHEANKLKLFGLQQEQNHLEKLIIEARKILINKIENFSKSPPISPSVEALAKEKSEINVAGCSADFINKVLKNIDAGDDTGGLNMIAIDEN